MIVKDEQIMKLLFLIFIFCGSAFGSTYRLNGSDMIGHNYSITAVKGDTLSVIAYKHDVGIIELKRANPHIRRLKTGDVVVIPKQFILPPKKYRSGVVLNMAELRLYYFTKDKQYVFTYPVSMGRVGWRTPSATTKVIKMKEEPTWHVPPSIAEHHLERTGKALPKYILPGPDNPLGTRAMYLGLPKYLIHGTNKPSSIGQYVSSGCIRMYNHDVEELFKFVSVGEKVTIINHKVKVGIKGNDLYLEAQPKVKTNKPTTPLNFVDLEEEIYQMGGGRYYRINWDKVNKVINQNTGIPEKVSY